MTDKIIIVLLILAALTVLKLVKKVIGKIISLGLLAVAVIYILVQLGVLVI
jgi:hypothetical protein